jgi:hypothetical protein
MGRWRAEDERMLRVTMGSCLPAQAELVWGTEVCRVWRSQIQQQIFRLHSMDEDLSMGTPAGPGPGCSSY